MNYMSIKPSTREACMSRIEAARKIPGRDWGAPWIVPRAEGYSDGTRYCENAATYFRSAVFADDVVRLDHTGWFTDHCGDSKTRGMVFTLPHSKFLAGYSDPWNVGSASVDCNELYDDEAKAARAADRLAERYAELCREDAARQQAEHDIDDAKEEIKAYRKEHREMCAELRALASMELRKTPALCAAVKRRMVELREEVQHRIETIKARRDDFWSTLENYRC